MRLPPEFRTPSRHAWTRRSSAREGRLEPGHVFPGNDAVLRRVRLQVHVAGGGEREGGGLGWAAQITLHQGVATIFGLSR
jgi:hypothetical protein